MRKFYNGFGWKIKCIFYLQFGQWFSFPLTKFGSNFEFKIIFCSVNTETHKKLVERLYIPAYKSINEL